MGPRAHPDVAADFLISWERWSDFHLDPDALRQRLREHGEVDAGQAARCFFELYANGQGKPRWGDKSPPHVNHIASIHAVLDEALFIHLIRDGRDVCTSMMQRTLGMRNPRAIARRWRREVQCARREGGALPEGAYVEVRYEDLTADPEAVLRELCDRLQLDWDPAMLEFHSRAADRLAEVSDIRLASGEFRTASQRLTQFERVSSPISGARAGAWRDELSAEDRRRFEAVAGDVLRELGYPTQ